MSAHLASRFGEARVRRTALSGLPSASATSVSASDSVLDAFAKLQAQLDAVGGGGAMGDPGSNGIMVRTATNAPVARSIVSDGNGVTVVDGDGVNGDPTIGLDPTGEVLLAGLAIGSTPASDQLRVGINPTSVFDGNGVNFTPNSAFGGSEADTVGVQVRADSSGTNGRLALFVDADNLRYGLTGRYSSGLWRLHLRNVNGVAELSTNGAWELPATGANGGLELGGSARWHEDGADVMALADGDTLKLRALAGGGTRPLAVSSTGNVEALAASPAYAVSNASTDRSFDADSTTLEELADVVGTLVADLKNAKILG